MAKAWRTAAAAMLAVMSVTMVERAEAGQPDATIVLHVANYAALPPDTLDAAKARVSRVYKNIGVRVLWNDRGETVKRMENGELHLTVLLLPRDMRAKKNSKDGTKGTLLGQAHLPSGRAYIFCDRIADLPGPPNFFWVPLADVIAHEVGHLLLKASHHSPSGLMRPGLGAATMELPSFNGTEARTIRATLTALMTAN